MSSNDELATALAEHDVGHQWLALRELEVPLFHVQALQRDPCA